LNDTAITTTVGSVMKPGRRARQGGASRSAAP
jgi:hypothetical protein